MLVKKLRRYIPVVMCVCERGEVWSPTTDVDFYGQTVCEISPVSQSGCTAQKHVHSCVCVV